MQKKIARKIASITAVSLASGLITVPAGANADLTPNLQIMQKTEIISDEALDQSYIKRDYSGIRRRGELHIKGRRNSLSNGFENEL